MVVTDPDHFSTSHSQIKCTSCQALHKQTFHDYRTWANHYREHEKWLSLAAITRLHKEQDDGDVASIHTDQPLSDMEIDVEDYPEEIKVAGNQGAFS